MEKSKINEALLVIMTALLVLYLIGWISHGAGKPVFLYLAGGVGISGIFLRPFGRIIALAWYKLAELLNWIMSRILLTIVYVLMLVPVAFLSRISKKDRLRLRRRNDSMWLQREHRYTGDDLDKLW